ncbi:MAG: DUF2892 domain-containing protein [Ignavibacteria bacterium]
MKKNMGTIDKTIRILLAIVFIFLFFTKTVTGVLGIILLVFAGIFLITSLVSSCPLYTPLGIKTIKTEKIKVN